MTPLTLVLHSDKIIAVTDWPEEPKFPKSLGEAKNQIKNA